MADPRYTVLIRDVECVPALDLPVSRFPRRVEPFERELRLCEGLGAGEERSSHSRLPP